jgi:hypothetical protein
VHELSVNDISPAIHPYQRKLSRIWVADRSDGTCGEALTGTFATVKPAKK